MKNIKILILFSLITFSLACDNTNSSKIDQTESSNNNNNDDLASIKKNAQTSLNMVKDPEYLKEFKYRRENSDIFKSIETLSNELDILMKNNASTKDEIKAKTKDLNDVLNKAKKFDEILIKAFKLIETVNKLTPDFDIANGENFADVNKAIEKIKDGLFEYNQFFKYDESYNITTHENKIKELQDKIDAIPQLKANSCAKAQAQADALKTEAEKLEKEAKDKNVEKFLTIEQELRKITGTSANEVGIAKLKFYYNKCDDKDIDTLKDLYGINDSLKAAINNFKTLVEQLSAAVKKAQDLINKTDDLIINENKNKVNYVDEQAYVNLLSSSNTLNNSLKDLIQTYKNSDINSIKNKSIKLEAELKKIDSLLTNKTKNEAIEATKEDGVFDKIIKEAKKLYDDNLDSDKFKDPSKAGKTLNDFKDKIDVAITTLENISKNNKFQLNNDSENMVRNFHYTLIKVINELAQAKITFQNALKN